MHPSIQVPKAEFQARAQKLDKYLSTEDLSGAVLFDNYYVTYFTDFAFIPTERPMALAVNAQGERALIGAVCALFSRSGQTAQRQRQPPKSSLQPKARCQAQDSQAAPVVQDEVMGVGQVGFLPGGRLVYRAPPVDRDGGPSCAGQRPRPIEAVVRGTGGAGRI